MSRFLRPCSACDRHVRGDETSCPFCDAKLEPVAPRKVPNVSGLSRAARIALGTALAAAVIPSCGKNEGGGGESIAQPYGVPPLETPPEAGSTPELAADDAGTGDAAK